MNQKEQQRDIDEDIVRFFVWALWNFFISQTKIEPTIEAPYLFDEFEHREYTGIIGVSGSQKGAVYFTLDKPLLDLIIQSNYGKHFHKQISLEEMEALRVDFAGEMANTVSGNVRNFLGEDFLISIPVVVTAPSTPLVLPSRVRGIIFPILWEGLRCHLVVALENSVNTVEGIEEMAYMA